MPKAPDPATTLFYSYLSGQRPMVLGLMGARYCGKSTFVTRTVKELSDARIPCGSVDAERENPDEPAALLDRLVEEFTAAPSDYGTVRFPRYLLARTALLEKIPPDTPANVSARMRDLLGRTWLADNLPGIVGGLAGAVGELRGLQAQGVRDTVAHIMSGIVKTRAGSAMVRRPGAAWFADNPLLDRANSADAGLARLWEWRVGRKSAAHKSKKPVGAEPYDEPDTVQNRAEGVLAAAFLEDLRTSSTRSSWSGTYALLIDNADRTGTAIRLVGHLVRELRDGDRVTVAVTHRGGLLAEIGAVAGADDAASIVDPARVRDIDKAKRPGSGVRWWPARFPDLSEDAIRDRLRGGEVPWDERACHDAAAAVHRFTRGHPGVTGEACDGLIDAAKRNAWHGDVRMVVDCDRLVDRLTRGFDGSHEDLVSCAAVRDRDHVDALLGRGIADTDGQIALMSDDLWVPGRAGRLVLLPVLRRMLLDRLAARPDDAPNGWPTIFGRLADHAEDAGDQESLLYYRLALGESESVVRALRHEPSDPAEWICLLKRIVLAPGRFGGATEGEVLTRLNAWAESEEPGLHWLADLVVRLWLAMDPLRPFPGGNAIANAYAYLAPRFPHASALLLVEAARWRNR